MPALEREETLRELGRMAREKREKAQVSLENIYDRTKIRLDYLIGIEQGNYQDFPDIVYTKGFVRTYLGMIGADDLQDDFSEWLSKDNAPKARNLPPTNILGNTTPPTKGFKPASHFWMFLVLILALVGAGGYVWYTWNPNVFTPFNSPDSIAPGPADVSDEPSFDSMPMEISHDQNILSIIPVSVSIDAEPEPEPEPPSLYIRARGDVWMSVKVGEIVVYSQTMREGAEASWDLSARAEVRYGRPNMAEIVLNGKDIGVPNPRGSRTSETYFYEPDGNFGRVQ